MKRISEFLRSVEPHPLLEFRGVPTTTTTTSVSSSVLPRAIKRLQTVEFNHEINTWIDKEIINTDLDEIVKEVRCKPEYDENTSYDEKGMERHLSYNVIEPCSYIIRRKICPGYYLGSGSRPGGVDFCLRGPDPEFVPLVIEIKTPVSVSEQLCEIIKERSQPIHHQEDIKDNKALSIIGKIWLHMETSCIDYAILTDGIVSIFFKRTSLEPSVMFVSEGFSNSDLTDSLSILARYAYFCYEASKTTPRPREPYRISSTSESNDTRRSSKRLRLVHNANKSEANMLQILNTIRAGNYCTIHRAKYDGKRVIVKMSYREQEPRTILQREIETYDRLSILQGKVLPRIYAVGKDPLGMEVMVMQSLLRIEEWNSQIIKKACDALRRLHEHGYVHGDISRDNFMQNETADVLLIDLEHARWSPTVDGTYSTEQDMVQNFLQ